MKKKIAIALIIPTFIVSLTSFSALAQEKANLSKGTSTKYDTKINYSNSYFNYSKEIDALHAKSTDFTTPVVANIGISAEDEHGATGVELVPSVNKNDSTDYYLNAIVAGDKINFSGTDIKSATDQVGTGTIENLNVLNGKFSITPEKLSADSPKDEVITITKSNGSIYKVHTLNDILPVMKISKGNQKPQNGVYTFNINNFLLRVDTEGNIVYYRCMTALGKHTFNNFAPQDTEDGRYYTFNVELNEKTRGQNGGYKSGMYVVMDKNYKEVNYITLLTNSTQNHNHGEGYLDEHEFLLLSKNHWIAESYTPECVNNLSVPGVNGSKTAYVEGCIIQEVNNGKVINEYNMTDYPILYSTSMESNNFSQSSSTNYLDYDHLNSICIDPKDGNLLVSMRNQYAVYKFNRNTGAIMWILGGKANQFSGLKNFEDSNGNLFIGQHYAEYVPEYLSGNYNTISVFDDHTNADKNTTRAFEITLNESKKTASATVLNCSDLDEITAKKHWSTHCGSLILQPQNSVMIGWGLNLQLDNNPKIIGTQPVFSDYDINKKDIMFELSVYRNSNNLNDTESNASYRTYKNAK